MIKTIIIDDEKKAIDNLKILLTEFCKDIEIVGTASSIKDGLTIITSKKPDLVFLDVEMPYGTGFDLISQLNVIDFQVIFVTAYNQYALQAIKVNALDYILKPIDIDELKKAVEKIELNVKEDNRLDSLITSLKDSSSPSKIALADDGGYTMVNIDNIIRCEASINYTVFHIENSKSITVSKTLKDFEEILPKEKFVRVHQSHLVNLDKILKYYKTDGGYVLMSDNQTVTVSRRKRVDLENYFLK